jgi:hypothetical protein
MRPKLALPPQYEAEKFHTKSFKQNMHALSPVRTSFDIEEARARWVGQNLQRREYGVGS